MTLPDHPKRIDLAQGGSFTFQIGVGLPGFDLLLRRIDDARMRLDRAPSTPRILAILEHEVHVCSVNYTHRIEGGVLSDSETAAALRLPPGDPCTGNQRRVVNIGAACRHVRESATVPGWKLTDSYIRSLHAIASEGVDHDRNLPGVLRDGPAGDPFHVGDDTHGGAYVPPQSGRDVERLLSGLVRWHDEISGYGIPPMIRAPLVHLYFELIHPFWAGNGLVGRLLEASILASSGAGLAPFSLWRFYAERVDRYFTLFNECRKSASSGEANPNDPFLDFHLQAMLAGLNRLHDRVNGIVSAQLFDGELRRLRDAGEINLRQYAILTHLLETGESIPIDQLRRAPWYEGLYRKMADKTKQRDLRQLRETNLVTVDEAGRLRVGFTRPSI